MLADGVLGFFVCATTGREAESLVQHLNTIGVAKIGVAMLDKPGGKKGADTLARGAPQAVIMCLGGARPGR